MVKIQQSFDYFSLNDLYNVLKARELEVNEKVEETRINLGGPLALVSKVSGREVKKEVAQKENSDDEGLIVNSDDEAVAFYSNNRVEKFYKNPFNAMSRVGESKGSFFGKVNEEKKIDKKELKNEESKVEKNLKGDSRLDCHYCNRVNHMANYCMLRKKDEKKNRVKDEAYYSERLEEVRAIKSL